MILYLLQFVCLLLFIICGAINQIVHKEYIASNLLYGKTYIQNSSDFNVINKNKIFTSLTNQVVLAQKKNICFYNPYKKIFYDARLKPIEVINTKNFQYITIYQENIPAYYLKELHVFSKFFTVIEAYLIDYRRWSIQILHKTRKKTIVFNANGINVYEFIKLNKTYGLLKKFDHLDFKFQNFVISSDVKE